MIAKYSWPEALISVANDLVPGIMGITSPYPVEV